MLTGIGNWLNLVGIFFLAAFCMKTLPIHFAWFLNLQVCFLMFWRIRNSSKLLLNGLWWNLLLVWNLMIQHFCPFWILHIIMAVTLGNFSWRNSEIGEEQSNAYKVKCMAAIYMHQMYLRSGGDGSGQDSAFWFYHPEVAQKYVLCPAHASWWGAWR